MKSQCNRRQFLTQVAVGVSAISVARIGLAEEEKGKLDPNDPYAKAMGFVTDTNNADKAKFPKHTVEQSCAKCQLFTGTESDEWAPCSFFGKRLVPSTGWCRNWKPKEGAA
jgi:hypothetical protein